jgi:PAS domain S-box-containing protein
MFRAVFEGAGIGMALVGLDGRTVATNTALQQMLGYSEPELRSLEFARITHPDDRAETRLLTDELLAGKADRYQQDKRYIRKDGETLHVHLTVSLVRDQEGQPRFGLGMVEDVTKLRLLEEAQRQQRARLATASEHERRQVAQEIAEEPLQLLTAVQMRLEVLARRETDESRERAVFDSIASTLADVIGRLRRLAFELMPPSLDRDGLVSALREYWAHLDEDRILLVVEDEVSSEPPLPFSEAAFRIAQEAIRNAREHADPGRITVRIGAGADGLWGQIRDDGRGFDVATVGGPEEGRSGLSSMRERAAMFGGTTSITSEPGGGTTVEFWLPAI